jgi:hypothetical protein
MQIRKLVADRIKENPAQGVALLFDEIKRVLDEPRLPRWHPDAPGQLRDKADAEAALVLLERKMRPLAKLCHQEILKLVDAQLPLLSDSTRKELKRWAQIMLLFYDAHYGPGGPYQAFGSEGEDNGPYSHRLNPAKNSWPVGRPKGSPSCESNSK